MKISNKLIRDKIPDSINIPNKTKTRLPIVLN